MVLALLLIMLSLSSQALRYSSAAARVRSKGRQWLHDGLMQDGLMKVISSRGRSAVCDRCRAPADRRCDPLAAWFQVQHRRREVDGDLSAPARVLPRHRFGIVR